MTTVAQVSIPADFVGTVGEWLIFRELVRLGKKPDYDFSYLPGLLGGRTELGGVMAQFLFTDPPQLAVRVLNGVNEMLAPSSTVSLSTQARLVSASYGITLVQLEEEDVVTDTRAQVAAALRYEQPPSRTLGYGRR